MSHIELSIEEQEILIQVLQNSLTQLEIEIDRTDSHDFREGLKHRRTVLRALLEKAGLPLHDLV